MAKADQLCWSCKKACGGCGCPWADKLKPVEGWTAEPAIIRGNGNIIETYSITDCPLYENKKGGNK